MKSRWPRQLDELRQKLVLTPEEKRAIVFVIAAFVLGVGTKCYRQKHFQTLPPAGIKETSREHATPSSSPARQTARKPRQRSSPDVTPTP